MAPTRKTGLESTRRRAMLLAALVAILAGSGTLVTIRSISVDNPVEPATALSPTDAAGSSCGAQENSPGGADGAGDCWPWANNTGVPSDISLSPFGNDCTISDDNVVIDSVVANCDLRVEGANLVVRNSKILGTVSQTYGNTGKITITDSEIDAGKSDRAAVTGTNVSIARSNLHGGASSLNCQGNCQIQDSFLHGQWNNPSETSHLGGLLSNGSAHIEIRHNTIQCDAPPIGSGGCSGNLNLFGDFGQINDIYIYRNLFPSVNNYPSYCLYLGSGKDKPFPHATNVRVIENVIERGPNGKCGQFGPYSGWESGNEGNLMEGNRWDDGQAFE